MCFTPQPDYALWCTTEWSSALLMKIIARWTGLTSLLFNSLKLALTPSLLWPWPWTDLELALSLNPSLSWPRSLACIGLELLVRVVTVVGDVLLLRTCDECVWTNIAYCAHINCKFSSAVIIDATLAWSNWSLKSVEIVGIFISFTHVVVHMYRDSYRPAFMCAHKHMARS